MFKIMEPKPETEKEKWRLAEALSRQLIQQWDLHARQLDDGRYVCVYKRFTFSLMYLHLKGDITLGAFLLDSQNKARFTVLDADDEQGFGKLKQASGDLLNQGIPSYLETSRRGGHLWLFFQESISGEKARNFALGLREAFKLEKVEVYPKQEELSGGPGSLIRAPFGIHRKSGQRYGFISSDSRPIDSFRNQMEMLSTPQTLPGEVLQRFQYQKKEVNHHFSGRYEKFKDVPLIDFVGQYVTLRPTASGAIGLCPFHDDDQPSFGVNKKGNYWNCFAGCGGGDIISFWVKWKNCDFTTAVKELEEVLHGTNPDNTRGC